MKMLAICSSPRKGGTFKVLNSIKDEFPDIDYANLFYYARILHPGAA